MSECLQKKTWKSEVMIIWINCTATSQVDITCFLYIAYPFQETGEFVYSPHIKVEDSSLEEDPELEAKKYDNEFIGKHLRKNWEAARQLKLC